MDRHTLISFLRDMLLARAFEERAAIEYQKGNIAGFLYLYPGEEAVAVGVLHAAEPSDYVVTAIANTYTRSYAGLPRRW